MRDLLGMPLAAIRQELLVATADQVEAYAAKAAALAPEPPDVAAEVGSPSAAPAAPDAALGYLRELRKRTASPSPPAMRVASQGALALGAPSPPPATGFEALEQRLATGRATPAARKARAEEWLRIPITPDVELAIRGRLDAESRAQLERCADLVRDILLGRDR